MNGTRGKCICFYKFLNAESISITSTTLELMFIVIIVTCGVTVNLRYRNELKKEKRAMPIGRRGNVIEPVMSWFCILQMIYWPYELLFLWISTNEVIPSESLPSWLCALLFNGMKTGRMVIAYNSLFIALIRYGYVVQHKRSNQWDYEKMSKCFKITSIIFPITMEILSFFVQDLALLKQVSEIRDCLAVAQGLNITTHSELLTHSELVDWTMQHLPTSLVSLISYIDRIVGGLVALNVPDAFLYLSIFRSMKR